MRDRPALVLLFAVAVVLRFGAAVALRDVSLPPDYGTTGPDGVEYNQLGSRMAAGKGFSLVDGEVTSFRPPGFPMFLVPFHLLPAGCYPLCYLGFAVLGGLACVSAFLLGRELLGGRWPWAAAGLCAVYPPHIYFATRFDSENLFIPLLGFALWLFVRALRGATPTTLAACGLLLGAATLTRSFAILLAPPLAAVYLIACVRNHRPWLAGTLACAAAWAAVVGAWTARNYAVQGQFILVNTNGGSTFYGGNNAVVATDPRYDGGWLPTSELPGYDEVEAAPDEVSHDAVEWRLGRAWVRANPDRVPRLLWGKLVRLCLPDRDSPNRMYVLLQTVGATPFLILTGLGLLVTLGRRRYWTAGWAAVHLTMAATVVTALIFWGSPRFRDANAVPMMVYAAAAFEAASRLVRRT